MSLKMIYSEEGLRETLARAAAASNLKEARVSWFHLNSFETTLIILYVGRESSPEVTRVKEARSELVAAKADLLSRFPRIDRHPRSK